MFILLRVFKYRGIDILLMAKGICLIEPKLISNKYKSWL